MPLFTTLSGRKLSAVVSIALLAFATVNAATLTVTTTADSGAGSLREAIAAASNGDTIEFAAALQAITLTSTELAINKDIRISGPGPGELTVQRSMAGNTPPFRIFHILSGRTVTIEGLTISNGGYNIDGAGIWNESATLTIDRCVVQYCQAHSRGGAIYNDGSNQRNAALTILNSVVSNNFVGHYSFPPFDFGGDGGGICNDGKNFGIARLTITKSIVSNNTAGFNSYTFGTLPNGRGGGIYNDGSNGSNSTATVTIVDSEIFNNNGGVDGGGIYSRGVVTITNSTLSGNFAFVDHDGQPYDTGAGISNDGGLTISNSTLSNNRANKSAGGVNNGGLLTIAHSTFSGNNAPNAGGVLNGSTGSVHIGNTILKTGTSGVNIVNTGTFTSDGYNLSSDTGGGVLTGNGDQINTDPMLGPLQDNSGSSATHAPLPGSPAIDAGNPNFTPPPFYDQRGPYHVRVFNGRLDIGSVEVQPTPVATPTPTPTATPSSTVTPTPTPAGTPASLGNISTRLRVETGDTVVIGGFIITGNASKSVVLRGIGPSLAGSGLSDVLADPTLELRAPNGALIFQNDDWQDNSQQASQLTALGLAPQNQKESGIVAELAPAAYTTVLAGKNGTGVGLVEIYDTAQGSGSQLGNISTRGMVRTGDQVMIGGFILGGGGGNNQIVVRGIGPSLAQFGLSPVLTDPTLELRDADGALLLSNDDWQDNSASAAQLVSHNLAPQNSKESGIYSILPPGAFTAILAGKNGGTGIGLVEIYNVP